MTKDCNHIYGLAEFATEWQGYDWLIGETFKEYQQKMPYSSALKIFEYCPECGIKLGEKNDNKQR